MEFKFTKYVIVDSRDLVRGDELEQILDYKNGEVFDVDKKHYEVAYLESGEDYYFVGFNYGDPMPHPEDVWDVEEKKKKENPRKESQVELRKQFFLYFDKSANILYLSNAHKCNLIKFAICERLNRHDCDVNVALCEDKQAFVDAVKSINSVTFTIANNLFSKKNVDVLDGLPDIKRVKFAGNPSEYELRVRLKPNIKPIVKRALSDFLTYAKDEFQDCGTKIVMTAEGQDGFLRLFNSAEMLQAVTIKVKADENRMANPVDVLHQMRKVMR